MAVENMADSSRHRRKRPEPNTEPSVLLLLIFRLRVVRFVFFRTYTLERQNGPSAGAGAIYPLGYAAFAVSACWLTSDSAS